MKVPKRNDGEGGGTRTGGGRWSDFEVYASALMGGRTFYSTPESGASLGVGRKTWSECRVQYLVVC